MNYPYDENQFLKLFQIAKKNVLAKILSPEHFYELFNLKHFSKISEVIDTKRY